MSDELSFETLLAELGDTSSSVSNGGYTFSELKMSDQRKMMNMSFNPIEIPARVANIFNEYIKKCVQFDGDIGDVGEFITVDIKPFVLTQLRIVTLGDVYADRQNKKIYTINPIPHDSLISKIKPSFIEYNNLIIRFCVPTLNKETHINNQLLLELAKFKKNLSEEEYGKVSDIYQIYELFKYITEIESGDKVFDFANCPINKKMKIINNLPHKVVISINEYIESSRRDNEIIAVNKDTGENIELDISTLFFENTARLGKNE